MSRGLPRQVKACVEKARESAVLAVEVYNKPAVTFRTGGYVSLMVIAWTSLFHAIFFREGTKPYFRKRGSIRFVRVDGDPKHWDLAECLTQYFGGSASPVKDNLEFIRLLRNKIEHRSMPEIDPTVFGECQACILNLEEELVGKFGDKYSINSYLTFPLRMTRDLPVQKLKPSAEGKGVLNFVEQFRAALSTDIAADQRYCFQVYLVPKIGNHPSGETVAVEFIHYDASNPEEMAKYEKVTALIKERQIPVANLGRFRPSDVVREMRQLGHDDFSMPRHTWAWKYYSVRPGGGTAKPAKCRTDFCVYDVVHHDYVYTDKWVKKLDKVWRDPAQKAKILASR
jgi:hypothetical protein